MSKLRTTIEHEGQRYVDDPVYLEVSRADPLALAVNDAFAAVPGAPKVRGHIEEFSHHGRVRLRWIKPDGLAPKKRGW